jgi:hypothetical protein
MKAKRTISIGLLIIAVLAMTVTPALAGGDNHRRRWQGQRFGLVGEVVEVEGQTITVLVLKGSRLVKDLIDEQLAITTDENTRFRRFGDAPGEFIALEDIADGELVSVSGTVTTDELGEKTYFAKRVTAGVPFECDPLPENGAGDEE